MTNTLQCVLKDDSGQGLVEYGLILSLVAVASIVALKALAVNINGVLAAVGNAL